jgi:hypothetical protein
MKTRFAAAVLVITPEFPVNERVPFTVSAFAKFDSVSVTFETVTNPPTLIVV